MAVTSVHYVTGQQRHLSTGGEFRVRRGATTSLNLLLNRSCITEGPIPVFKSRPIWGQRKGR